MGDRIDEAVGNTKKTVGDVVGNDDLKKEGESEAAAAKLKRESEGAVDKVAGKAEEVWGDITDDPETKARGAARQVEGDAKRAG